MARIAIVTENDGVWGLSAWERTLPLLAEDGHDVAGLWVVPGRLGKMQGMAVPLWYLRVLGVMDFGKLVAFAVVHRLARWRGQRVMTLKAMAEAYGVSYHTADSPNDAALARWVRKQEVEVVLISVGHILKGDILAAPSVGIINKHAGVLPQNKGLWPFVWAVVEGMEQGVSYHVVNERVDAGALLVQDREVPEASKGSMIAFYVYVYGAFGRQMTLAVEKLLRREFVEGMGEDRPASTLPDAEAMARFRNKGGVVMRMKDIGLAVSLLEDV